MKANLSIAVMALLGYISAQELTGVPIAEALLQSGRSHHHQKHSVSKKVAKEDDFIFGHHQEDYISPYDPNVADAPEDIKRVGNDHEELHNAKLSPTGYYKGFFHKDYQGNYAQTKHHKKHAKKSKRHHKFVQLADHRRDTDDVVETMDFVQQKFDHENDSDDVVEEFSDMNSVQTRFEHENDTDDIMGEFNEEDEDRRHPLQGLAQIRTYNNQEKVELMEHDLLDADNVQLRFDHENDSDDFLEQDQLEMTERQNKAAANSKMIAVNEDFADVEDVQLNEVRIPHENDTDDVETEGVDFNYNRKHSKAWNEEVNKKAMEFENEMKIEENMKLVQKKAEEDAKRKAEQDRVRKAEEKRRKLEEDQKKRALEATRVQMRTIDLGELYHGIDNIEMLQLDSEYNRHSHFMQRLIDNTEKMVEDDWTSKGEDELDEVKTPHLDKLEENNNVQLKSGRLYEKHHQMWLDEVDKAADKLEKEMDQIEQEQ